MKLYEHTSSGNCLKCRLVLRLLDLPYDALQALDRGLSDGRPFLAGDAFTVADIAVYGYGHCGADAGADPRDHPHVAAWLDRVEATPGFVNDLEPVPSHVSERPL